MANTLVNYGFHGKLNFFISLKNNEVNRRMKLIIDER